MSTFPLVFPVTCHTDCVGIGSTFVAIQGMQNNGVDFISLALERGAKTIVVQQDVQLSHQIMHEMSGKQATLIRVENTRKALAELSAQALNHPSKKLKIIAITGTKGKTTSTFLIEHLLRTLGHKTALLSTVHNKIVDTIFTTQLTTQQPDYLHVFLQQCVEENVEYVVMEVAAQALSLDRVHGIEFDAILFTNFDREHGEFYSTMEDYFQAKCSLFNQRKNNGPVFINLDDAWCSPLAEKYSDFLSFSLQDQHATFHVSQMTYTLRGMQGYLYNDSNKIPFSSALIGVFNAYNILGALAVCNVLGHSLDNLVSALTAFYSVPGRMELIDMPNGARACIDYAHNPSSCSSVLSALRALSENIIVVCGAGGDRDKTKRPIMGALAVQYADFVIFTSDNPRSEDPADIIKEMMLGVEEQMVSKVSIELDREVAIKKAYELSGEKTIIALLGKGPDHYQIIQGQKIYFNEKEILKNLS